MYHRIRAADHQEDGFVAALDRLPAAFAVVFSQQEADQVMYRIPDQWGKYSAFVENKLLSEHPPKAAGTTRRSARST